MVFFFLSLLPPSSIPKIPWVCEYFSFSLLFSHSGLQVYPAHLQEQELSVTKGCQSSHVKEETWFGASFSASLITKHLWAREFKRLCLHHLWIFLPAVALISLPAQPGTIPQHPKLKKKKKILLSPMKAVWMVKTGCWEKTAPGAESLTLLELVRVISLDIASYLFSVCHWAFLLLFFCFKKNNSQGKIQS